MTSIHPTAIVEEGATIGKDVKIGPYSIVGNEVHLEDGVEIQSHAIVSGRTRLGKNTKVFPFASIGCTPQDLKYKGEVTELIVGANCIFREHATVSTGTSGGGGKTVIGNNGLFMNGTHVAHDCIVQDNVILSGGSMLAGHCVVGNHVIISGQSNVSQKTHIGDYSFIAGMSLVSRGVPPYSYVKGSVFTGVNVVGLKRRNFNINKIKKIQEVLEDLVFANGVNLSDKLSVWKAQKVEHPCIVPILSFIENLSARGMISHHMQSERKSLD